MANKAYVAAIDGVMVKAEDQFRTLYKDAPVPANADADHVKTLVERGLLVDAPKSDAPVEDHSEGGQDGPPAKSASKAEWVDFAVSQGATQDDAEAQTKDDLIAAYGGE